MADEVDLANETAANWLAQTLSHMQAAKPRLQPKGCCHYCETEFAKDEPDAAKKLFCDLDCSQDYEEEQRLKNRK